MPETPVIFISCGQSTAEEIALGGQIEKYIREETPFEPYFAEEQNTLEGLVANILSALHRTSAFVGIMHHRGEVQAPSGDTFNRASVWVEQELAICSFIQHVLNRQLEVAIYLQRGVTREGIRSQLLLKPIEFDNDSDVMDDLRSRIEKWQLGVITDAPLVARWTWERKPGFTGERHDYEFFVELFNSGLKLINEWKVELWFPSFLVPGSDPNEEFVYKSDSDTNHDADERRVWPRTPRRLFSIRYTITNHNWPGWRDDPLSVPMVRLKVSTSGAAPWEEEIAPMDIQSF